MMAPAARAPEAPAPVPPSALEKEPDAGPNAPPPAEGAHLGPKAGRLDYYLGTGKGRSRVMLILWIVSIGVMAFGYALMLWIWYHGGL